MFQYYCHKIKDSNILNILYTTGPFRGLNVSRFHSVNVSRKDTGRVIVLFEIVKRNVNTSKWLSKQPHYITYVKVPLNLLNSPAKILIVSAPFKHKHTG